MIVMLHFIESLCSCKSHMTKSDIVFSLVAESCSSASLAKVSVKAILFIESGALGL